MSNKLQNLLKYRFQKKEEVKIQKQNENSPTSSPPVTSGVTSIPDTPEKKLPATATPSPVFNRNQALGKRGVVVIASDDEETPTPTPLSTQKSSPGVWMNARQQVNGSSSQGSTSSYSPSVTPSSSQSTVITTDEEREFNANVRTLQSIFPGKPIGFVKEALQRTRTFAEAENYIISNNYHGLSIISSPIKQNEPSVQFNRIKRPRIDSTDEEASPMKKAKQLNYSESSQDTQEYVHENGLTSQDGHHEDGVAPDPDQLAFLTEAFPNYSEKVLTTVLRRNNNDVELAIVSLSSGPPEIMESPKKPTTIKEIRESRAQNKALGIDNGGASGRSNKDEDVINLDDEDEGDYNSDESDEEDGPTDPMLNFFNDATVEEMSAMNGCSKKKAEAIAVIRPFSDWDDLVAKFGSGKELSLQLITSCKEIIQIRNMVTKLMQRCEKLAADMESVVTTITSRTELDDSQNDNLKHISEQPDFLNPSLTLKPYQMVGLNWLALMHDQGLNGILGDEMGLGKTIQTIAFLAHLLEEGEEGPHLIVAPSSTLDNWLRELDKWCPSLKVIVYYGSQEERRNIRYQILDEGMTDFHILMTTYNMASGSTEDRVMVKRMKFEYAIFDEGHMLKNMSSMRYQSLMKIRAQRRLLLTGTPLQNNLVELMSLLAFVMPEFFINKTDQIKRIFTTITSRSAYDSKGKYEKEVIANAKNILKPFFLRRLKNDVLQQLPKKSEEIERVHMCFDQQELYDDLKRQFSKSLNLVGTGTGNPKSSVDKDKTLQSAGASMMMQLRKAANHHLLHRRYFDEEKLKQIAKIYCQEPDHPNAVEKYVIEDMEVMSDFELHRMCNNYKRLRQYCLNDDNITDSGKFRLLDSLLPTLKERGDRVLLFSQFTMVLDIVEVFLKSRSYKYIRLDGQTAVADRIDLIDQYNNNKDIFVFLLSTKAGGLGINLTAANTVILHDIDFNPYNDKQAEDRCHRLGQTRDVTVIKLISKGTIEEAMLRCAAHKLKLEQDVTGQGGDAETEPSDVASLLKEALNMDTGS